MNKRTYLKKPGESYIFPWTPLLATRTDMVECDAQGKIIHAMEPEAPAAGEGITIVPPPATEPASPLDRMTKEELIAEAARLGIRVHPSAKEATIIQKIRGLS